MSKELNIAGCKFKAPPVDGMEPDAFVALQNEWIATLTAVKEEAHSSLLQDVYSLLLNLELVAQYKLEVEEYAHKELSRNPIDQQYDTQQSTLMKIARNSPIENTSKIAFYQPTDLERYPYILFEVEHPQTKEPIQVKGVCYAYDEFDEYDDLNLSMDYVVTYGSLQITHKQCSVSISVNGIDVLQNYAKSVFGVNDLNLGTLYGYGKGLKDIKSKLSKKSHTDTGEVRKFIPGKWLNEIVSLQEAATIVCDNSLVELLAIKKNIQHEKEQLAIKAQIQETLTSINSLGEYGF